MTASLIVAGYELIGGTTNPEYRLAPDFDFGAGEPDQATISSLYLDGETVSGDRTSNRVISLPVTVFGATALLQSQYVSVLLQAVSQDTFTVQWTPDGGLPVVFDCFRATWSRPRTLTGEAQGHTALALTFQAKPFGRSPDDTQTITATSSTQVDSYDTAPTGATLDTTYHYEGTGSAKVGSVTSSFAGATTSATVSRSFAAKDLSAASQVAFWHTFGNGHQVRATYTLSGTLTLTSASGSTRYDLTTLNGALPDAGNGKWAQVVCLLAVGTVTVGSGVTLSAVTSYSLAVTYTFGGPGEVMAGQFIDDLRAMGSGSAQVSTAHGSLLAIPAGKGSARAPVNLAVSNGSTFSSFLLHSPPSDQDANAGILQALSTASTDQTITVAAANAKYAGTYAVLLGVGTSGGGAVTAVVTVTQLENGTAVGSTKVLTKAYMSGALLVPLGGITLPLYDVPADNSLTTFTIRVQITGADRFSELMLLDTAGQTWFSNANFTTARAAVYVDEPAPLQSGPSIYAAATDRTAAFSVLDKCAGWGGPILFEPGTNRLLVWVGTSSPTVTATYDPRWLDERVS